MSSLFDDYSRYVYTHHYTKVLLRTFMFYVTNILTLLRSKSMAPVTIRDFELAKDKHPDKPCDKPAVWEHHTVWVDDMKRGPLAPIRIAPPFEVHLCNCIPHGASVDYNSALGVPGKCLSPRCINASMSRMSNPT